MRGTHDNCSILVLGAKQFYYLGHVIKVWNCSVDLLIEWRVRQLKSIVCFTLRAGDVICCVLHKSNYAINDPIRRIESILVAALRAGGTDGDGFGGR